MILQKENKVLREKAKPVGNPRSPEIKRLISKMADAMWNEPDGIGIAAPQIGESLRVFLVSKEVLDIDAGIAREEGKKKKKEYFVFINPEITKFSAKKRKDVEGCLSVRGLYGEVLRPEKLNVEYADESGEKRKRGASGLFARAIQHEIDHLNGVLFIDKAKNIRKIENA